jgi:fucose permease
MLAMSALFLLTRQRWANHVMSSDKPPEPEARMRDVLHSGLVWLQIIVFFLYTGLESTLGQWSFTLLTESRNMRAEAAGIWVGMYYGSIGVGRVLLGVIAERLGLDRLIRLSTLTALIGAALFAFSPYFWGSLAGLALSGFGLAAIFPCLMTRTPQRLAPGYASHAIGFQVSAAMLGAATMPGLAGLLVDRFGLESAARVSFMLAAGLLGMHELLLAAGHMRPKS